METKRVDIDSKPSDDNSGVSVALSNASATLNVGAFNYFIDAGRGFACSSLMLPLEAMSTYVSAKLSAEFSSSNSNSSDAQAEGNKFGHSVAL